MNAVAPTRFRHSIYSAQNFTRIDMSMNDSSLRRSGNHTLEFCGALVQKVVAGPSDVSPEETPLLQM